MSSRLSACAEHGRPKALQPRVSYAGSEECCVSQFVDLSTATHFLAERYGPAAQEVVALGGGDWSRAYGFRLNGRDLVVRFGQHVEDYEKDRWAMQLSSPELPVPEVLEIGRAGEGYFAVSERRFGKFLEELDECEWRTVLPALLRGLDELHCASPPSTDVCGGWREWLVSSLEDRPGGRVNGWREVIRQDPAVDEAFVAARVALMALLPACPEIRHVLHRDLLNRNVIVSEDATRLEAVFDWGCSCVGDYLYELAWLTFWSPWYPA